MPFTQIHLSDTAVYNTSLVPRKRNQTPGIHPGNVIFILATIHNSLSIIICSRMVLSGCYVIVQ